jgi:hypothetical protein
VRAVQARCPSEFAVSPATSATIERERNDRRASASHGSSVRETLSYCLAVSRAFVFRGRVPTWQSEGCHKPLASSTRLHWLIALWRASALRGPASTTRGPEASAVPFPRTCPGRAYVGAPPFVRANLTCLLATATAPTVTTEARKGTFVCPVARHSTLVSLVRTRPHSRVTSCHPHALHQLRNAIFASSRLARTALTSALLHINRDLAQLPFHDRIGCALQRACASGIFDGPV